jgi:ABC-type lipoprotein export system ATPase subunit
MLKIKNLYVENILHNINLSIKKGSLVGIFGVSGSGKTTLLKTIKGFNSNYRGEITFNNEKIDLYNKSIGYIFQENIFFNHLSLMENFLLTGKTLETIQENINYLNLGHLLNKNVKELSGGEKQRLGICRSLLMDPQILLMDEPTSALDYENRQLFYELFIKLNKEKKITIIMISHDKESKHIFNEVYYITNGKIENFIEDSN